MKLLVCTQKIDKNDPILGFFVGWVNQFAKHFDHIDVICLEKGEHDLPKHVKIHSLGKEQGSNKLLQLIHFYVYFGCSFFKTRPDYVFFHMGAVFNILATPFFFLRKLFGIRFYWWKAHGGTTRSERLALSLVDNIYTATTGSFPVETTKKKVIGHAIDTNFFTTNDSVARQNHFLFIGRIMPIKRLDILIGLVEKTGVSARIVGPITDTEYIEELKKLIEEKGLESKIKFVGGKTGIEVLREYQTARMVINPSETGSVDKVVLEAMASGTPVLAPCDTYALILGQFDLCVKVNKTEAYNVLFKSQTTISPSVLHEYVKQNHSLSTLPQRLFDIK